MTRHVVFGTGQVGRLVVERLVALGVATPLDAALDTTLDWYRTADVLERT